MCTKSSHLNIQLIPQWEANKQTRKQNISPLKCQLIQLHRPSSSLAYTPQKAAAADTELLLQMAWPTALGKGVCWSHSHQGPCNAPHQDRNNQALPPLLFLLVFTPYATSFFSSSSGKLDYFMMATGHSVPDPP